MLTHIGLTLLVLAAAAPADTFQLEDGDRVVLIGGTLIEREQKYGYWETALTIAHPDKNITFRNLGWSGDTVWGESRAGFDTPVQGYQRLVTHTLALKPTVIIVGYGSNESFAGEAGLPRFEKQLDKLLDDLEPAKARIVLLAPPLVDEARWTGGKVGERNRDIKLYTQSIKKAAEQRQARFVSGVARDLGEHPWPRYLPEVPKPDLTDNGVHLTAYGYWHTRYALLPRSLETHRFVELDGLTARRVRQKILANPLPPLEVFPPPRDLGGYCLFRARNLPPGKYVLRIDGQSDWRMEAGKMEADKWKQGVLDLLGVLEAEQLRKLIVDKNQLYFHRWRPQNETYLFGFRKKEQGQNAKEIPEFDPLIEKLEKEIAKLKVPVEHTYQLVPAMK